MRRMVRGTLGFLLYHLQSHVDPALADNVSDGDLLDRFVRLRDEAAFELLALRHGPMVLRLCQRLLNRPDDVDDAFQATFLTLVRKASAIGKKEALAGWLYTVAYRTACRARTRVAASSNQDEVLNRAPAPDVEAELVW